MRTSKLHSSPLSTINTALGVPSRVIRKELFQRCGSAVVALTLIRCYKERALVGDFWNSKLFVGNGNNWQCKVWQVFRVD
jgi:hypothetical protein